MAVKIGTSGSDTLTGGSFQNLDLWGGLGNDTYIINGYNQGAGYSNQTHVFENANAGTDTLIINAASMSSYILDENIENLTVNTTQRVDLYGNALNNVITGGTNNDDLYGGSSFSQPGGKDTLIGGDGNDDYFVDSTDDVIVELADQGFDSVYARANYTLSANVEQLNLQDFVGNININGTGNLGDNELYANGGNNVLSGLAGDDYIEGNDGNDTLLGGDGNDELFAGDGRDSLDGGNGNDYLESRGGGDTLTGGAGDDRLVTLYGGGIIADSASGGAGNDTYYVFAAEGDVLVEAAGAGTDSVIINGDGFDYVVAANIENADASNSNIIFLTGNTSDNNLIGNDFANVIEGLAGADFLDGGDGSDTLIGGDGNDSYAIDNSRDQVVETNATAAGGIDTVYVRGVLNYTLGANVENVTLINEPSEDLALNATGNALNNLMIGNYADNNLRGGAGDDTLNGGLGADVLSGGTGNDTYIVDSSEDKVIELAESVATAGTRDKIILTADFNGLLTSGGDYGGEYTLQANVEQLDGSAVLNNLFLTGNKLNNVITGGKGNDLLEGRGGNDTLIGGEGNDAYFVDSALDVVTELAGTDLDTVNVFNFANYTMAANVEIARMLGGVVNVIGNAGNNDIFGNSGFNSISGGLGNDYIYAGYGKDTLDGGAGNDTLDGGAGADTLKGGAGDDTYFVSFGDIITDETAGIDTVQFYNFYNEFDVTYDISTAGVASNGSGVVNIENLSYLGSGNFFATGNALANKITGGFGGDSLAGGAGNDTLDGGNGVDTMIGGTGDDTYFMNVPEDVVIEAAATATGGVDTVNVSFNYTAADGIEKVVAKQGVDFRQVDGNSLLNTLTGNEFDNSLFGGFDTLADTMIGGGGNDFYFVRTTNDVVVEALNGGYDTVAIFDSSISYTLGANIEALDMVFVADNVNNSGTGNTLDNYMRGANGNNTLSGLDGDDDIFGNDGNDTLLGGNGNDELYGGSGNDSLVGGAGDDYLEGGYGSDIMLGGLGNDEYVVSNEGDDVDVVTELAGQGTDTVYYVYGGTYTLANNVEIADFTYGGNVDAYNFTGNALNNIIRVDLDDDVQDSFNGGAATEVGADRLLAEIGYDNNFFGNSNGAFVAETVTTNITNIEQVEVLVYGDLLNSLGAAVNSQHSWTINSFTATQTAPKTITILGASDESFGPDDQPVFDQDGDVLRESGALQLSGIGDFVDVTIKDYLRDADRGGVNIFHNGEQQTLNATVDNVDGAFRVEFGGVGAGTLNLKATGGASVLDVGGMDTQSFFFNISGDADLELDDLTGSTNLNIKDFSGNMLDLNYREVAPGIDGDVNLNIENTNTALSIEGVDELTINSGQNSAPFGPTVNSLDMDYFSGADITLFDAGPGGSISLAIGDFETNILRISATSMGGELILDGSDANSVNFSTSLQISAGSGDDYLIGSSGNDTISGGLGGDVIFGGGGNDVFVFSDNADTGIDALIDFNPGDDTIQLLNSGGIFTGLNVFNDGSFEEGTNFFTNADVDDAFIGTTNAAILYNNFTGALYYDADGSGEGLAVQFAQLGVNGAHPSIAASNLSVIDLI